ncbi:MAG: hypothetical protein K8T89_03175 [Planctomycetes bacterium]|nr:hypothetical protein [Planctomycetota bacterium]
MNSFPLSWDNEHLRERLTGGATSLSDEEFRAVHRPMRFVNESGIERTETDFLTDPASVTIEGASGSGRSHFQRWLELERRDKQTASPAPITIERLIAALDEEQKLAQERVAATKAQGTNPNSFDRDTAGWLAKGLIDLFTDPIAKEPFLLRKQPRFSEADFLRPENFRFMEAGRAAQSMVTKLNLASTNQYRVAAARLMNQILDRLASPAIEKPSIWRIIDWSPADADAVLDLAGAYLDLAPFKRDELLAHLFRENEPSVPTGVILERLADMAIAKRLIVVEPQPEESFEAVFAEALTEVDRAWGGLTALVDRAALFHERGLLRTRDIPRMPSLEKSMTEVVKCVQENPRDLLESKAFRNLLKGFAKQQDSLRNKLADAWTSWRATMIPVLDEAAMRRLEAIPENAFVVREIREIDQQLAILSGSDAVTFETIQSVENLAAQLRARLETIPRLLEDAEVDAFLAAVANGGAPLELLTEVVLRRLRETTAWEILRVVAPINSSSSPAAPPIFEENPATS